MATAKETRNKSTEVKNAPDNFRLSIQISDNIAHLIGNSVCGRGIQFLRRFEEWETDDGPLCRNPGLINSALLDAGSEFQTRTRVAQHQVKLTSLQTKSQASGLTLTTKDKIALAKAVSIVESGPLEELSLLTAQAHSLNRDFRQATYTILSLCHMANLSHYDPDQYQAHLASGIPSLADYQHQANRELFGIFADLSARYGLSEVEVYQTYQRFFNTNGFNQFLRSCSPNLWTFDRGLFALLYAHFNLKEAMPQVNFTPGDPYQDRFGLDLVGEDQHNGHQYYIQVKGEAKDIDGAPRKTLQVYPLVEASSRAELVRHIARSAGIKDEALIARLGPDSDQFHRHQIALIFQDTHLDPKRIDQALSQLATVDALLSQASQCAATPLWVIAPSRVDFVVPGVKTSYEQYLELMELVGQEGETEIFAALKRRLKSPDGNRTINYSRLDAVFGIKHYLLALKPGDIVLNVSPGRIRPAFDRFKSSPQFAQLNFVSTLEADHREIVDFDTLAVTQDGIEFLTTFVSSLLEEVEDGNTDRFALIIADNLLKYDFDPQSEEASNLSSRLSLLSLVASLKIGGQLLIHDDDVQKSIGRSQLLLYAQYLQIISQLPPELIVTTEIKKNRTGSYLLCTRRA